MAARGSKSTVVLIRSRRSTSLSSSLQEERVEKQACGIRRSRVLIVLGGERTGGGLWRPRVANSDGKNAIGAQVNGRDSAEQFKRMHPSA